MRHSQSIYPVGAAWSYIDEYGNVGSVWLASKSEYGFEIWRWSFCYSDGSGRQFDHCFNKSSAVSQCSVKFRGKKPRFKRQKPNKGQNPQASVATVDDSSTSVDKQT